MSPSSILVVDDEADIRSLIQEILVDEGYLVHIAADGAEARSAYRQYAPDLVLLDIWMPDVDGITLLKEWSERGDLNCPVVIMSGHGTVETAVEATRLGAVDYIEKPLSLAQLLRTVETALDTSRGVEATGTIATLGLTQGPQGKSAKIRLLREQAGHIASHGSAVLLSGESGTGREMLATYMHSLSGLADQPLVKISGASLTDESHVGLLFGADAAPGLLEQATGGTFYVGDLDLASPDAQIALFTALEHGSFLRPGSRESVSIDTRVMVSASAAGSEETKARLNSVLVDVLGAVVLKVPPLREYREDVPELLGHHVEALVDQEGLSFRHFGVAAQNRLRNYPWPGNQRELKQLVRRLLIVGGEEEIGLEEIEAELQISDAGGAALVKQDVLAMPLREAREEFERAYLTQQLALCGGKVGRLAERVGMERTHLYRKLRSLGIDFRQSG